MKRENKDEEIMHGEVGLLIEFQYSDIMIDFGLRKNVWNIGVT